MSRSFICLAALAIFCASAFAGVLAESRLGSRGGLPWVEVRVSGARETLNFVVDTGAAATVLDRRAAERLGVKLGAAEAVQGVHSRQQARRVNGFSATVAGVPLSTSVLALDLSAASRAIGQRIDGLVGADFFRRRVVQLDPAANALRVLSSFPVSAKADVLPVRMINSAFAVPVRINGGAAEWVRLDTGCTEALHWVGGAAAVHRGTRAASVGFTSASMVLSTVSIRLGDGAEQPVRAAIHSRQIFAGEAGLLGNKLLASYRVTVDGIGQRVVLERR